MFLDEPRRRAVAAAAVGDAIHILHNHTGEREVVQARDISPLKIRFLLIIIFGDTPLAFASPSRAHTRSAAALAPSCLCKPLPPRPAHSRAPDIRLSPTHSYSRSVPMLHVLPSQPPRRLLSKRSTSSCSSPPTSRKQPCKASSTCSQR